MIDQLIDILNKTPGLEEVKNSIVIKEVPAKTILLNQGDVSKNIFIIKKGSLRLWYNKDGKDITIQFFFENQPIASVDSLLSGLPSKFTIESIEPSTIAVISKESIKLIKEQLPDFESQFNEFIFNRFRNYAQLFMSRIIDTPLERYNELVKNNPEILQRVPQHYIASYLGITPVSLSRIRKRK